MLFFHGFLHILLLTSWGQDFLESPAPKQYIIARPLHEQFSERTSSAPFTEILPNPLSLNNSAFDSLFLPSTTVQAKSQGSPSISIRGSSQAARVLFILDEVPLNFADGFGGSHLLVPIEITKNIQMTEGPTSTLYGANAMGGAIHFKTAQQTSPLLRLGLGNASSSKVSPTTTNSTLILPLKINDTHSLQGSLFLDRDRGDFSHTTDGSSQTREHNNQNLRRFTIGTQHKYDRWKVKTFHLYTGLNKTTPGPLHTPILTNQKSDVFFSGNTITHTQDHYSSTTTLTFSRLHSQFHDNFGFNFSNSQKVFLSHLLKYKLTDTLSAFTILDFNLNFYDSSYTGEQAFHREEPEIAQTLTYDISPRLTIEPSIRYLTRYRKTIHQINIPYRTDQTRWWLGLSEGFRPPSLTDFYAQTPYFVGNVDLRPERSTQIEVGGAWETSFVQLTSSLFKIRYEDLFRSLSFSPGVLSKVNVDKASSEGMNFGLTLKLHPNWIIKTQHSLLKTRDKNTQNELPFSPQHQSFASLSFQKNKWSSTLQHSVWSSFLDTDFNTGNLVRLPQWNGTDWFLSYKLNTKTSTHLGVFNIFDNPRQLSFDFPEPQRRFFVNIEIQL